MNISSMARPMSTTIALLLVASCGSSLESEQLLTLEMYGVYVEPATAPGNADPEFADIAFRQLVLTPADGTAEVTIKPGEVEKKRIINRPQIIHSEDFADHEGASFSRALLTFDRSVVIGGKYADDYSLTLSSSNYEYVKPFSVPTGKGLTFVIKINWRNTITRDRDAETETVSEPEFAITVEN